MIYLKNHQHSFSTTSKKVQMDLNRMLLIQAIIPIFSAFLPISLHIISGFTDFDLVFESFFCGMLYSWIPVGNAVSVLFFVTAYRDKLKRILLWINIQFHCGKINSTTIASNS